MTDEIRPLSSFREERVPFYRYRQNSDTYAQVAHKSALSLINVDKVRVVPVPYGRSFAPAGNLVITDSDFSNSLIK